MWIERESEIKKIENAWKDIDTRGKTVIMLGAGGVGKYTNLKVFSSKHNIEFKHYRCERSDLHIPLGALKRFMSVYYPQLLAKIRVKTPPEKIYDLLINALAEDRKIVYFARIDYADYLSLKFITYFALNAPKGVMLVVSYPTEVHREDLSTVLEQLIMEDLATVVLVDALSPEEVREMIKDTPFENKIEKIMEKSGGNPMYISFLLRYWKKSGKVKIFRDLTEAITENYELLPELEKNILKIGSVAGNIFFKNVVEDILEKDVSSSLKNLLSEGWIMEFSQRYGKEIYKGYVFLHEIIRDTIESLMDEDEIRELHNEIARSIEKRKVYFPWERTYELAYHYTEGDNRKKAIKYLTAASQQCMEGSDYNSAAYYLKKIEKFVNSLDEYAKRIQLYGNLSYALRLSGNLEESTKYDDKLIAFTALQKADTLRRIGKFKEGLNMVKNARKTDDPYLKMLSYRVEGDILRRMGLYHQAFKVVKKHLNSAKRLSNEREMAIAYKNLGNIYLSMRDVDKGEMYYKKAMEIFRKLNDLEGISAIYNNMGIVYSHRGYPEKARQYYTKSLRIDEKRRSYEGMGTAYNNIGTIYEELGKYDEAIDSYEKSIKYNILTGSLDGVEYAYSNLSSLYTEMGRFKDAIEYADREIKIAKKMGSVKFLISGYMSMANIYFHVGDYKKSLECAKKAWSIAEKHKNYFDGIDAHYYMARAYHAMKKDDKCVEHINFALKHYREWKIEDQAAHLYSLLARCKGEEVLREMEKKVKIYSPMDECEILMAKAIVYSKEPSGKEFYKKAVDKLRKLKKYATLSAFIHEYASVSGDNSVLKDVEEIEREFEYP